MGGFRLSPRADSDLDDIWLYAARGSGSIDTANRPIASIVERIWLLAHHPQIGRRRDDDLRPGLRSFPAGQYVIIYRIDEEDLLILHVLRGSRDLTGQLEN